VHTIPSRWTRLGKCDSSVRLNEMKKLTQQEKARGTYGIMFLISLPIPVFHYKAFGHAIWTVRYPWGLHPIEILNLWELGRFSVFIPIALILLVALSWKFVIICKPETLVRVAIAVLIFSTIYAINCALAFWMQIIM